MRVSSEQLDELIESLVYVEDPRVQGRCRHTLLNILVMSICAILSGAESCQEIAIYSCQKEGWLRKFLDLGNGLPSHDTFARVLSLIDPLQVESVFSQWGSDGDGRCRFKCQRSDQANP